MIRRSLFVLVSFVLLDYPGIQIQVFLYMTVLYIVYLNHGRIYEERLALRLDNTVEMLFMGICYHMVLFCDLLNGPDVYEMVGVSLIVGVVGILGLGFAVMLGVNIAVLYRKLRVCYLKRRHKKEMALSKEDEQTE